MGFDELEWVREVIDRWLCDNAPLLALMVALLLLLGQLFLDY